MGILQLFKDSPTPTELGGQLSIVDQPFELEANSPYSLGSAATHRAPAVYTYQDGDKFAGGFGVTELLRMDYWTLRKRSAQLFTQNLYARGIIRRMVTNEINTGLTLECLPEESLLGLEDDALVDWSDDVEKRFNIYAKNMADWVNKDSFSQIQRIIRRESLIEGDILVSLRQDRRNGVPQIQLISGNKVRTPIGKFMTNVRDGVELDNEGRHLAYWVIQKDGTYKRLAAFGKRSGRRLTWLVYSTDKRKDEVRGEPLLALILQSLKEIDRYRDAALRKSVINSILAMFISKDNDKMGTTPMTGAATARYAANVPTPEGDRRFKIADYDAPGVVMDELQQGETPHAFKTETDVDFGKFEESIVQAMAWAIECPPEILRLTFSSNYSASQASINEYKMYLDPTREYFAEQVNQPIYNEWLLNEVMNGRVQANGFLEAWRSKDGYALGAWLCTDWAGAIKPSVDMVKMAKAAEIMVDRAWISNDRVARELTGTKFGRNVKRNTVDNEALVEMRRPMAEFLAEMSEAAAPDVESDTSGIEDVDSSNSG